MSILAVWVRAANQVMLREVCILLRKWQGLDGPCLAKMDFLNGLTTVMDYESWSHAPMHERATTALQKEGSMRCISPHLHSFHRLLRTVRPTKGNDIIGLLIWHGSMVAKTNWSASAQFLEHLWTSQVHCNHCRPPISCCTSILPLHASEVP